MHRGLVIAVAALVACDQVWRLDDLKPPSDAAPDSRDGSVIFMDGPEACPVDYVAVANAPASSRYRYVMSATQTWELAEKDCENDSVTDITHLVVFDDPFELAAIRALAADRMFAGYARDSGSDLRRFFALTGEELPDTVPPWAPNEPNGGTGSNEETIVWFGFMADLIDGPYTQESLYVCECDHRRVTRTFTLHP